MSQKSKQQWTEHTAVWGSGAQCDGFRGSALSPEWLKCVSQEIPVDSASWSEAGGCIRKYTSWLSRWGLGVRGRWLVHWWQSCHQISLVMLMSKNKGIFLFPSVTNTTKQTNIHNEEHPSYTERIFTFPIVGLQLLQPYQANTLGFSNHFQQTAHYWYWYTFHHFSYKPYFCHCYKNIVFLFCPLCF